MSSQMLRVLALCGALGSFAGAQSSPSLEAQRRATVSSYEQLQMWLRRAHNDSAVRAAIPIGREYAGMKLRVDTTQVPHDFMDALDAAYRDAVRNAAAVIGPPAHALLTRASGSIMRGTMGEPAHIRPVSRFGTMRLEPLGGFGMWSQTVDLMDPGETGLRSAFEAWFGNAAVDELPGPIRRWTGRSFPFREEPNGDQNTYRIIARANVTASSMCLTGKLPACRSLLAIEPGNDTATSFLSPDERRQRVARYPALSWQRRAPFDGINPREAHHLCVAGGDDAACRDALRVLRVGAPLGGLERMQLLRLAIEIGGSDAFDRLRGSRDTDIGAILETTAGVPLDSLTATWQRRVYAARPASPAPSPIELALSCAMIVGALAISVGRRP